MGGFAVAVRLFVFHGLLILGNLVPAACDAMEDDACGRKSDPPPPPSAVSNGRSKMMSMRSKVYFLAAGLWRLFGIDWLFVPK